MLRGRSASVLQQQMMIVDISNCLPANPSSTVRKRDLGEAVEAARGEGRWASFNTPGGSA